MLSLIRRVNWPKLYALYQAAKPHVLELIQIIVAGWSSVILADTSPMVGVCGVSVDTTLVGMPGLSLLSGLIAGLKGSGTIWRILRFIGSLLVTNEIVLPAPIKTVEARVITPEPKS